MVAAWGGEAKAGLVPFTYSTSPPSGTLTYTDLGASGTVTTTPVSGSSNPPSGGIPEAPSFNGATIEIASISATYNPTTPGGGYVVQGTQTLTVTLTTVAGTYDGIKVDAGTGTFTITETFSSFVSATATKPIPALNGEGQSVQIGNVIVVLNALAEGNNIHGSPGNFVLAGFEFHTTPEPGSVIMTGIGSLAVAGLAIRRRKAMA